MSIAMSYLNRRRSTAVLAAALLCLPVTAMAAGMPQMDFANPLTTSLMVWGVLIFFVLYLLLSRWALPQVGAVLQTRAGVIGKDLDLARAAQQAADAAVAELTEATRVAHASAQAEVAGAVAAAKAAVAAQAAVLNARLEGQLAAAERQIGQARAAALGALRQVATETAMEVVGRLSGIAADAQAVDRAVGQALAARHQG
jgi:F-type H+-transporting ATPase subunit b